MLLRVLRFINSPGSGHCSHQGDPTRPVMRCVLFACWLTACSSPPDDLVGRDAEDDFQGCPEGIPSFEPGLETTGVHSAAQVVAAMPAEPERYLNDWIVELHTLDGSPDPDAE